MKKCLTFVGISVILITILLVVLNFTTIVFVVSRFLTVDRIFSYILGSLTMLATVLATSKRRRKAPSQPKQTED